jgi:SAM-dependent methyltransferase
VELDEYDRMDRLEERMWWYRAAHAILLAAFRRHAPVGAGPLLDAGCGTGGLLARLAAALPGHALLGVDVHSAACRRARAKSGAAVVAGSVNALPFKDASLDAIFSVDVLCHRAVEPAAALGESRRCLRPGGVLIVNLPAYQWLKSAHDARVHNERRFTRPELRRLLAEAGLRPAEVSYWNSLLFPLMVARRLVFATPGAASDVMEYPYWLDRLFAAATAIERWLIGRGVRLPFGGSVFAVAVRDV